MQQEEIRSMASRIASIWTDILGAKTSPFLNNITRECDRVQCYRSPQLLEKALQVIPVHQLYENASAKSENDDELCDHVTKELLHWFKNDFFTWVDAAPCDHCKSTSTKMVGAVSPTPSELEYGGARVEHYFCSQCSHYTRFPRYNDPGKLLETRRGRCGEWANCFTLCCQAMGLEPRYVHDNADHVWTEVYSTLEKRWIHCDPCEDAYDRPLMYEAGWNKKLGYCIAYSPYQVMDVTRRYVVNWNDALKRRHEVAEDILASHLQQLCTNQQQALDAEERAVWVDRQQRENKELQQTGEHVNIKREETLGRQSGAMEWRMQRGEQGQCSTTATSTSVFDNLESETVIEHPSAGQMECHGSASFQSSASPDGNLIRLTLAVPDQCGGAFLSTRLDLKHGFELKFAFNISNAEGGPATGGADGMAIVIQGNQQPRLGDGGCELGYGGIRNSLAIEFDTYPSVDRAADPSDNHISVHARLPPMGNSAHHRYSLGHTSAIPSLNSGQWIFGRVRYLTSASILSIELRQGTDGAYTQILTIPNLDLDAYLDHQLNACWLGFTAATGGLSQCHQVKITSLRSYTI
ncbi:concanavalin A-like lectin/glucanase [Hesseltinella vesiculosa]|uniref:Concanavalin A-like lectin/glucanase n=1 Tax=Hesseltinella vesiculosa TaxID=101127 RepID=A0A1X2GH83_9FUNG|nr:concanavalin A-like lectin/glucanase [Hesseltinella vesiculosa]